MGYNSCTGGSEDLALPGNVFCVDPPPGDAQEPSNKSYFMVLAEI